jgi:pimeloyl-ACP methyl ester carboxylesterase
MKIAFLISGYNFNQTSADPKYASLRTAIAAKGYKVVPSTFVWNHTTVAQYVPKFVDFYQKNKGDYNILIGNSYGAMVAFLATPATEPNRVLLCSLSPYFAEDYSKTTKEYRLKRFGKRREVDMKKISAKQTAEAINKTSVEITLMYGENEDKILIDRVKSTAKDLKNSEVIEVPNGPHHMIDPIYTAAIAEQL